MQTQLERVRQSGVGDLDTRPGARRPDSASAAFGGSDVAHVEGQFFLTAIRGRRASVTLGCDAVDGAV
jgi:hypothetical protein